MAYSDFDLKKAVTELRLTRGTDTDLFANVSPVEPSDYLRAWLTEFGQVAINFGTPHGRRDSVIFPILAEAKRHTPPPVTLASGVTFDVDPDRGLVGVCDYLVTRSPESYFVVAPTAVVVAAKSDDANLALGPCAASMVAVRQFNNQELQQHSVVSGCVTTGREWRFLMLEGSVLTIDTVVYALDRLPAILGILVRIASG